jgi:hypothetical protein
MKRKRNKNGKKKKIRNTKHPPTPPNTNCDEKKQPNNVKHFNDLGSRTTKDARRTREMKSRIVMAKAAFNKKIPLSSKLDLNLRKKLVKCYIMEYSVVLC